MLDATEAQALRAVFGDRAVPVVAIKGALGESGAAGCAGIASALLFAERGVGAADGRPGHPRPGHAGRGARRGPARRAAARALVLSVGSGGTVVAVVVEAA